MEHLQCMTPDDLIYFIYVTEMEVLALTPDVVVIKGASIFLYVFDYLEQVYCFTQGRPI